MKKLIIVIIIVAIGAVIGIKGYSVVKKKFDTNLNNNQQTLSSSNNSTYTNNQNNNSVNNKSNNSNNQAENSNNTINNSNSNIQNTTQPNNISSENSTNTNKQSNIISSSQTNNTQSQESNTTQASNTNNINTNSSVMNNTTSNPSTSTVNTTSSSSSNSTSKKTTTNINLSSYMGVWKPTMEAQWNQVFNKNIIPTSKQLEENTLIMTPQKYSFKGLTINNPEYKIVPVESYDIFGNAHMGGYSPSSNSIPNSEVGIPKTPYSNLYYIFAYSKGESISSAEYANGYMSNYPYIVDNHVFALLNSPENPLYRFTKQ